MSDNEYYEALLRQSWKTGCLLSVMAAGVAFFLLCLAKVIEK